jgi:hypothetical protein
MRKRDGVEVTGHWFLVPERWASSRSRLWIGRLWVVYGSELKRSEPCLRWRRGSSWKESKSGLLEAGDKAP